MGFGHRDDRSFDGVMRLAFCLDTDLEQQVGVEVRQAGDRLDLVVHGDGDLAAVTRQVARVVSADHDGAAYAEVCAGDPVLARVHAAAPGFRPANFHSAFEAAAWSVLSARRQRRQAIALRARLAEQHGARVRPGRTGRARAADTGRAGPARPRPRPAGRRAPEAARGRRGGERGPARCRPAHRARPRRGDGRRCSSCPASARSTARSWWSGRVVSPTCSRPRSRTAGAPYAASTGSTTSPTTPSWPRSPRRGGRSARGPPWRCARSVPDSGHHPGQTPQRDPPAVT